MVEGDDLLEVAVDEPQLLRELREETFASVDFPAPVSPTIATRSPGVAPRAVVLATGAYDTPVLPAIAQDVPAAITQLTPHDYRSPEQLDNGGVLVVGASATGLQYADELVDADFDVTIATGEHVRLPRSYRGRDIFEWMDRCGILDQRYDEIDDIARGRGLPSAQLVGSRDRPILDLNSLTDRGATLAGRVMGCASGSIQFSGSLRNVCALADLKMKRLLRAIERHTRKPMTEAQLPTQAQLAERRVAAFKAKVAKLLEGEVAMDVNYGLEPDEIEAVLGWPGRAALIHRDDMAM